MSWKSTSSLPTQVNLAQANRKATVYAQQLRSTQEGERAVVPSIEQATARATSKPPHEQPRILFQGTRSLVQHPAGALLT